MIVIQMGKTPFHLAMETSNAELATFLDQQGEMVDRTLKDKVRWGYLLYYTYQLLSYWAYYC